MTPVVVSGNERHLKTVCLLCDQQDASGTLGGRLQLSQYVVGGLKPRRYYEEVEFVWIVALTAGLKPDEI